MNGKLVGTILGVIGAFLWFMPLANIEFMDMNVHQSGNHIGGIAYLLLLASLAYSVLSWLGQHIPRIIAASLAVAISLLFLVQAADSAAWGLRGLFVISAASIFIAVLDVRQSKTVES